MPKSWLFCVIFHIVRWPVIFVWLPTVLKHFVNKATRYATFLDYRPISNIVKDLQYCYWWPEASLSFGSFSSPFPLLFVVIWGVGWRSTSVCPIIQIGHPGVVRLGRKLTVVVARSLANRSCRLVLLLLLLMVEWLTSDAVVVSENPLTLRRSLGVQDDETGRWVTW